MKNLNSLLARLGALSLAAAMTFSAAQAATARKDPKAAAAVIEALVQKSAAGDAARAKAITSINAAGASAVVNGTANSNLTVIDSPVVVGKAADGKLRHLTVFGNIRAAGDVEAGALGMLQTNASGPVRDDQGNFVYKTPGRKHLIGITSLDPRTQQFRIAFKEKTAASHGAFVSLDFVTTATGRFGSKDAEDNDIEVFPSGKKATVGVRLHDVFCHPQMTDAEILAGPDADTGAFYAGTGTSAVSSFILNGYSANGEVDDDGLLEVGVDANDFADLRLKVHVRVEDATTNNVNFGFVPASTKYPAFAPSTATVPNPALSGFYESAWTSVQGGNYPVYDVGTLSYQVASDNVVTAQVVSAVANGELLPADVFELFTEEELASLLAILKDYFGEDVVKMREYLVAHRHQLSRAFRAIR